MTATSLNSKFRVNSNGFALFVLGLTIAGFLGGAVRFFLNSERVQQRILTELKVKLPEWQIEADHVQLLLASGIWPGVTMVVPKAKLVRSGDCELARVHVRLVDLRLPVSLLSIIRGSTRLGSAYVQEIDIEIDQEVCGEKTAPQKPAQKNENSTAAKADMSLQNLGLKKTYDEFLRRIDGLEIEKLTFTDLKQLHWSVAAQPFKIEVGSWVRASGSFVIWKRFALGEVKQNFDVDVNLQNALLDWKVKAFVKEGEIEWFGQLDEAGRTFLQTLSVRRGPIGDLFEGLKVAGIVDRSLPTRRAWMDCRLSQGGSFRKLRDVKVAPLRVESCGLEVEGGKIQVSPVTIYTQSPHFRNGPLEFNAKDLPVQMISEIAKLKIADRVISDLGRISGRGQIYAEEKWNLRGEVEDLRLSVSNQSLRGTETISSFRFAAQKHWDELKLELTDFRIPGGSRGGKIEVVVNPKTQVGRIDVAFDGLLLSNSVQGLLFRGRGAPIVLKGSGQMSEGKIRKFDGHFQWPTAEGYGWKTNSVSGNFKFREDQLEAQVLMGHFGWTNSYFYGNFLKDLMDRLSLKAEGSELSKIQLNLKVQPQGGLIPSAKALFADEALSFQGQWARSGALEGVVTKAKSSIQVQITDREAKIKGAK